MFCVGIYTYYPKYREIIFLSISLNFTPKDERRNLQIKRQRYFNFFSFHTDAVVHLGYMDKWRFPANYFANFFNENDCTVWNNLTLSCFLKKMTGVAGISGYQDDCVIFSIVWCKWKKKACILRTLKKSCLWSKTIYIIRTSIYVFLLAFLNSDFSNYVFVE